MSVVMRPVILLWTLGLISGLLPLAHPASIPQTHGHPTQDLTTLKRDLGGAVPVKEQLVHVTQAILQGAKRFAAAIAEGMSALEAARYGCAVAGLSVTKAGTAPAMPDRKTVEALLR